MLLQAGTYNIIQMVTNVDRPGDLFFYGSYPETEISPVLKDVDGGIYAAEVLKKGKVGKKWI